MVSIRPTVDAVMNRQRLNNTERTPLPRHDEPDTLSLALLQRLYRYVASEGYGE